MTLPVAILAGGLATRLRPITEKIPKALVEVCGEPFVHRQLRYLRNQGIERVVMCVGYLGDMVVESVGDGSRFGLDVQYSPDGDVLLGTGGALKRALPMLGDAFFVLYGDSFLPVEFAPVERAFLSSRKKALMTVLKNGDRWDKSNVVFRDGVLVEYNKRNTRPEMEYIDYGLGAVSASIFEPHPQGEVFDLADTYHALSIEQQLAGYEVHERFYEIGSHSGLAEAEEFFSRGV